MPRPAVRPGQRDDVPAREPAHPEPQIDGEQIRETRHDSGRGDIVSVEGHHVVLLSEPGYDASIVEGDRISSLDPIRETRPDLIIVDLRLVHGELSGWEILSQIRDDADLREVAILVCTADQEELKKRGPQLADVPRLATMLKPFTVGELERKVSGLLR